PNVNGMTLDMSDSFRRRRRLRVRARARAGRARRRLCTRRVGEMLRRARELGVRADLVDRDVDGAEALEVTRDATEPAGLGVPGIPAEREQLDEAQVVPVGVQRRDARVVLAVAL